MLTYEDWNARWVKFHSTQQKTSKVAKRYDTQLTGGRLRSLSSLGRKPPTKSGVKDEVKMIFKCKGLFKLQQQWVSSAKIEWSRNLCLSVTTSDKTVRVIQPCHTWRVSSCVYIRDRLCVYVCMCVTDRPRSTRKPKVKVLKIPTPPFAFPALTLSMLEDLRLPAGDPLSMSLPELPDVYLSVKVYICSEG